MDIELWGEEVGVVEFPDGRRIRGRGLRNRHSLDREPQFGLYLLGRPPSPTPWESRWLKWPDFWLPSDVDDAADAFQEAFSRSQGERVEIACGGGTGRTGTALACLAVLAGIPNEDAVAFVRTHYRPRAVETPWQRRFIRRFTP